MELQDKEMFLLFNKFIFNECLVNKLHIYAYLPDIGANMCDTMYSGIYHGNVKHQSDIDAVFINIYTYFTRYRC